MSTPQLKKEVENFIKNADERFLKMVHAMALAYSQKQDNAYTYNGTILTKEELVKRAMESEKAIKEGRVISIEELEKEMRNW